MAYRYFLKLSFDGTGYTGWQVQKNSSRTVQQKVNHALSRILNEKIEVHGCCRTDAGVHAKELFADFDSSADLSQRPAGAVKGSAKEAWIYKFNSVLPADISVDDLLPVKPDASARYKAVSRTYQYCIHPKRDPFLVNRSYYYYSNLDLSLMNKAARLMMKYRDFSSFSKVNTQAKTALCRVSRAEWKKRPDGNIVFTITADRFLRGMVRLIAGTLLLLGKNRLDLEGFEAIIESKDCRRAGPVPPACGLYLVDVQYPKEIFLS